MSRRCPFQKIFFFINDTGGTREQDRRDIGGTSVKKKRKKNKETYGSASTWRDLHRWEGHYYLARNPFSLSPDFSLCHLNSQVSTLPAPDRHYQPQICDQRATPAHLNLFSTGNELSPSTGNYLSSVCPWLFFSLSLKCYVWTLKKTERFCC